MLKGDAVRELSGCAATSSAAPAVGFSLFFGFGVVSTMLVLSESTDTIWGVGRFDFGQSI